LEVATVSIVYLRIIKYLTEHRTYHLPLNMKELKDRIYSRRLLEGMHLIYIDDPLVNKDSLAFSLPAGYFNELRQKGPIGLAFLVSRGLLNAERYSNGYDYHHRVMSDAQLTVWSTSLESFDRSFSTFWKEYNGLVKEIKIKEDIQDVNFL
jgi:hypothetical protein